MERWRKGWRKGWRSRKGTEEGTQETEERLEVTKEACEEEERCEEDSESHLAAKRARVSSTFTDSQETAIVEFVKEHPELYDKEHARFHDRQKKEALWAEISAELKLQPFDVRRPTSDERGPAEVQGSRPVQTPASRTNLVDLLMIQNTLIPVF